LLLLRTRQVVPSMCHILLKKFLYMLGFLLAELRLWLV
jgi:hypothetical protein